MEDVRKWWNRPLCIAGDMNAVRTDEERNIGDVDTRNNALQNNYIMNEQLVDQPLIGSSFTWSNNHADPLLCRLDRFLFSLDLTQFFIMLFRLI